MLKMEGWDPARGLRPITHGVLQAFEPLGRAVLGVDLAPLEH